MLVLAVHVPVLECFRYAGGTWPELSREDRSVGRSLASLRVESAGNSQPDKVDGAPSDAGFFAAIAITGSLILLLRRHVLAELD